MCFNGACVEDEVATVVVLVVVVTVVAFDLGVGATVVVLRVGRFLIKSVSILNNS